LLALLVCVAGTYQQQKPNILFIMVDDYGWANVGFHRDNFTSEVRTPNIDQLVRDGVILDRHYTHNVCSPTRSSFLSGRAPVHVNVDNGDPDRYNPKDPISGYQGVPPNMTIVAAKLKSAGYATHFVGKWDIGMATEAHIPIKRGFDSSFGYFHHANNYWTETAGAACDGEAPVDLWWSTGPATNQTNPSTCNQNNQPAGCIYEDHLFLRHVLETIDTHNPKQPLFIYWAPHNLHEPLQVPKNILDHFQFIDHQSRKLYASMVFNLDLMIGEVIAELKDIDLYDNTLIVLSADNGGPVYANGSAGANNWPLRGGKTSNWEGGIRVNALASGGLLPQAVRGTKQEGLIGIWDWYATFCALAGVDPTDVSAKAVGLPPIDSINMWPLISGATKVGPRHEILIGDMVAGKTNVQGIIEDNYKLLVGTLTQDGWQGPFYPNATVWDGGAAVHHCTPACLFDIFADPTEHHDIAAANPTIVNNLLAKISDAQKNVFSPDRGTVDPAACAAAKNKYKGYWGPFV